MIKTLCVGTCSTTLGDDVCKGCKRFCHEIVQWNGMTGEEKSAIITRCDNLMLQIARRFFVVNQYGLLKSKLESVNIECRSDMHPASWIFELLRTSSQFVPEEFGLHVLPPYDKLPLSKIRSLMDTWYYNDATLFFHQQTKALK